MKYLAALCGIVFSTSIAVALEPIVRPLEQKTIGFYTVILPNDYESTPDKEYPACVIIHGSGSSEKAGKNLVESNLGSDDVIYICPRALFPKNDKYFNQTPGFTAWPEYSYQKSSSIEVAENDQIDPDIIDRLYTKWIHDCVEDARKHYRINDEKLVVLGHSQGGAFSLRYAIDYPDEVKACFLVAGYYEYRLKTPEAGSALRENNIYVYFTHNRDDHAVKFENSELLLSYLEEHGVDHAYTFYDSGGHRFHEEEKDKAKSFVDNWARGMSE